MSFLRGALNVRMVRQYEAIQLRRVQAWFAFEDQRWEEAAEGFQAVVKSLRSVRRAPINVDLYEDLASASYWRCRALLALHAPELALSEAAEALGLALNQAGEASAAARWAFAAQIRGFLGIGADVNAAARVEYVGSIARQVVDRAEICFIEAAILVAAAVGDLERMYGLADVAFEMATQFYGESAEETLWPEALRATASAALARGKSIEGLVTLQKIRTLAAERGVSSNLRSDIGAVEAWAYDRFGAHLCTNDNQYKATGRWDRVREGSHWLCDGHCDRCEQVIIQRVCAGDCLRPCELARDG
jgi:hypothetical protein